VKQVSQLQADEKKFAEQFTAAEARTQGHRAEVEAVLKSRATADANLKAAIADAARLKAAIGSLTTECDSAAKIVKSLDSIVPSLKDAAEKGTQAAAKVTGDKEIAAAAGVVNSKYAKMSKEWETAKGIVVDRQSRLAQAKLELAAADKRAAEAKTALDKANKRLGELGTTAKAVAEADQAKQSRDAASHLLVKAQQDAARWREEIGYRDKMLALAAVQAKSQQLAEAVQSAQTAFDAGKAEIRKLEQGVAAAQKQSEAAAAEVKKAQDLVVQLNAEHAATIRHVATLEGLIPALQETLAKVEETARRAPEDADVAAQVNQFKTLIAKKGSDLELAKKAIGEKAKAIESAKTQIPVAEKKLADSKPAIEAAKQKVAEATAGLKPLEEKIAAAKSAMNDGTKHLEAAKKELDAMKTHRPT